VIIASPPRQVKVWINIDHHPSNRVTAICAHRSDRASHRPDSFELLQSQDLPLDEPIAEISSPPFSTEPVIPVSQHDRAHFRDRGQCLRCGINVGE
jgi:hypothetical protein